MDPVDFENNFRVGSISRSECSASCNNCGVAARFVVAQEGLRVHTGYHQ